jgi:hypothetical protein
MADQNIVQTLFGFTPQNVQQQMISAGDQQAMELAKLSRGPVAASEFYGLRAAGRVGTNPLFTQNLPQVQKAGQLQQIIQQVQSSGVDMSTPDGLIELANALNTNPEFSGMAVAIRQEANKLSQAQLKSSYEIAKMGSEITKNIAQADKEKIPVPLDVARQIVLNFAGKTDLTPEQQQTLTNAREVLKLASPGTNVKVEMKGQENVLEIDKEDAKAYRASRESASKAIPVLNNMQKIVNQGIIQGTLADARVGFLKALDTFGLSTAEARKVVGNNEEFNIQVRNLLQSIIKQFGYNPSNADVRFALESLPTASNSPEGLRTILNSLIKANKDQLNESTRALDYYRKNKGSFEGFQPNLEIVSPGGGMRTVSQMTDDELRAEIARLRSQNK